MATKAISMERMSEETKGKKKKVIVVRIKTSKHTT